MITDQVKIFFLFYVICNKKDMILKIFGNDWDTRDGTCIRDFIHVVDLADSHVAALRYLNCSNGMDEIFNVGTGKGTSILELINTFMDANNVTINYEYAEKRVGDIMHSVADVSKIKDLLFWSSSLT